jgi:hypothetical protein
MFLRGFSVFSCPQHSLKVLLLLNPTCLLKHVLNSEKNFSFFIFQSGLSDIRVSNSNRIGEGLPFIYYVWFDGVALRHFKFRRRSWRMIHFFLFIQLCYEAGTAPDEIIRECRIGKDLEGSR